MVPRKIQIIIKFSLPHLWRFLAHGKRLPMDGLRNWCLVHCIFPLSWRRWNMGSLGSLWLARVLDHLRFVWIHTWCITDGVDRNTQPKSLEITFNKLVRNRTQFSDCGLPDSCPIWFSIAGCLHHAHLRNPLCSKNGNRQESLILLQHPYFSSLMNRAGHRNLFFIAIPSGIEKVN